MLATVALVGVLGLGAAFGAKLGLLVYNLVQFHRATARPAGRLGQTGDALALALLALVFLLLIAAAIFGGAFS